MENPRTNDYFDPGCFTPQQLSVLRLMTKGFTDEKMAQSLYISVNTVRYHKKRIFNKLKVNNCVQAVLKAVKLDIVSM